MDRMTIDISGMSCGHCVASVKKALEQVDGVQVEQVAIGKATVLADAAKAPSIRDAIEDAGYEVVGTH